MKINIRILLLGLLFFNCSNSKNEPNQERIISNFNKDWKFIKQDSIETPLFYSKEINDSNWEDVSLPHTANVEPLITGQQWQGVCWYRKKFTLPKKFKDKHLALYFEGAMHTAEVWVNEKKVKKHKGGYLPFYIELTNDIYFDKENIITIKLSNKDDKQVPPGKPIAGLDFNYYGGLYRNVHLIAKDKVHITNSIQTDIIAGGGVFVNTLSVNNEEAELEIKTDVLNGSETEAFLVVKTSVYDVSGDLVAQSESPLKTVNKQSVEKFEDQIILKKPMLWSPETPNLYEIKIELVKNKVVIDNESVKFGVRSIKFEEDGFYLNGKPYKIRGTNRHQEYPYIGYALPDNAQYRDAHKIKEAGFNFIRLSHYPHSESFMNACDELGILVMDAIPGWQFFGDKEFQENCYNDIRQMVRRDRNHPSVILWEASLNESGMTEEFMDKAHNIVHEEFPGVGVYTCGWIDYAYDVFIPARQHAKAPDYWKKYNKARPIFIAEYGDWEYYAQNAGFNQKAYENLKQEERTSRQLRGNGQVRLAQQALNYQESHNDNLYNKSAGDANWLMFDYNRGYAPDIESSGVMDIFRLPKFAYYFYSSQKEFDRDNPVLFIANYWNDPMFNTVKVYSNCEEVELWLNDELIERRKPDTDKNSTNLLHPPFTFQNVKYKQGKLVAKGFYNGKLVEEAIRVTPRSPKKIEIAIDEFNVPVEANKNDVVFIYARIVDETGNYVPVSTNKIQFKVQGNAELIGENPIKAEAGIASILLKLKAGADDILITAFSEGLEVSSLKL
ncbi:glycoside hydrolase family 2 TIM barrel-domain containing protein [Tamlana sp. 2201CG12-4]|uniref:glycoside hydrolase family 2 protein n=1 Tax=Tamlana sp. 2201CG12-4 TaxID=3112582 RepID=UPI002DBB2CC6|nr:glycoside hydrolase family 2 TIM barrel-domain containing protein [Tamlana sp. 2201CG12-4]MEC3908249.1 glycoside hydrolase family 2 TIM barrel-domain containing protein [Tamlana sp. 2201CG12-4]